jgi:hypothetical protein
MWNATPWCLWRQQSDDDWWLGVAEWVLEADEVYIWRFINIYPIPKLISVQVPLSDPSHEIEVSSYEAILSWKYIGIDTT